jgi:hypothetical protein
MSDEPVTDCPYYEYSNKYDSGPEKFFIHYGSSRYTIFFLLPACRYKLTQRHPLRDDSHFLIKVTLALLAGRQRLRCLYASGNFTGYDYTCIRCINK